MSLAAPELRSYQLHVGYMSAGRCEQSLISVTCQLHVSGQVRAEPHMDRYITYVQAPYHLEALHLLRQQPYNTHDRALFYRHFPAQRRLDDPIS